MSLIGDQKYVNMAEDSTCLFRSSGISTISPSLRLFVSSSLRPYYCTSICYHLTCLSVVIMAKDESISVHTAEVFQDDASDHPITRPYTHSIQPEFPPQWPAEPHPLTADPTTERWLKVFDITLCLIPLALIAKAILCIIASVLDKDNSGPYVDEVHDLTIYLIRFNHQVSPSTSSLDCMLTEEVDDYIHCCVRPYHHYRGQTFSSLHGSRRSNCCKARAITG